MSTQSELRPRSLVMTAALAALSAATTLNSCGPAFADCHSRRACPEGGRAGDAGAGAGEGGGVGGSAASSGGVGGSAGTAGAGGTEASAGQQATGGSAEAGETAGAGGLAPSPAGATSGASGGAAGEGGTSHTSLCEPGAKPPRLIAPLSTALVTSRRPSVEFEVGDDCGRLVAEFCADRACRDVIARIPIAQNVLSARPPDELPQGVTFWRVRSGSVTSAVWQFTAGKGTSVDTWWGTIPDFNGDGRVDVAVGTASNVVYVYYGSDDGLEASSPTVLESEDETRIFGSGLASAGDVNGDGYADLIVGAPVEPEGGAGSRIYVFRGGPDGVEPSPFKILDTNWYSIKRSTVAGTHSVVRGGVDINGDGYGDFVGTGFASYVPFFGSQGEVLVGKSELQGGYSDVWGCSIALCDINGDRNVDMVVGAPDRNAMSEAKQIVVYQGTGSRFDFLQDIAAAPGFGTRVVCADFANDGRPDALASNPESSERGHVAGETLSYANASGTLSEQGRSLTAISDASYAASGAHLAVVGDMDGDGTAEVAVSQGSYGVLRVLFSPDQPAAADYVEIGGTPDVHGTFGWAATAGDVDGDGLADLIVSTYDFEEVGRITIFLGSRAARIISPSTLHIDPPQGVTGFGKWLSAGL